MRVTFKSVLGIFVTLASLAVMMPGLSTATTSNRYVINPATGIAMFGYDLVSYFTDQESLVGQEAFEIEWDENYWYFTSAANADRFLEAPHAFLPKFNGYGAHAVALGRLAQGNPAIWALYENQLFFFHSISARNKWVENPAHYVEDGKLQWHKLSQDLVY